MSTEPIEFDAQKIERPDPVLMRYYLLTALLTGPLSPIVVLPLWFRYITLRYKFDDTGVSMSWGVLFRKEIYLTYRRLQDIHLTKNILQRWMGLAKISLQTASGNSQAEMTIEGILEPEALRDFLYRKMRGSKAGNDRMEQGDTDEDAPVSANTTELLTDIRDAMRTLVENKSNG